MAPPSTNHWKNDKRYNGFLNFIIKQTENIESPMNVLPMVKDFKKKSGDAQTETCLRHRVYKIRTVIHRIEHIDTNSKVKVLFALSAPVDAGFLKKLRKDAVVEVDEKERITHYKSNDKSLELNGYHSLSEKHLLINKYFKNKNDGDVVPKNKEEKEVWNLIQLITEKCENGNSPLNITQLTKDFNNHFGSSRSFYCIWKRVKSYCREVQKTEFLDNQSKVKQLFCLGATLDSNFLKELRKDADVEVDSLNRITKYIANNGRLTLYGDHSQSAKNRSGWIVRRKNKKRMKKRCISVSEEGEESEKENEQSKDDSDEYSSEEFDSEFDSDEENNSLDETTDLLEPSNTADDNEAPVRNRSPIDMPIDDNFDFDSPTERSHASEETEMREDDEKDDPEITENAAVKTQRSETLPKSKSSSSTSHTPKTPKRKADASAGSSTSKRTKPPPIKEEYEEESQTSLKTVLNAFKSLILSLDNSGLLSFQKLDNKILETGSGVGVSNKEVTMAMDFFIVKLSKHGALKSSEDSISLRDILLMLRTIILNSSFNGLEVILEMLKKNIEQLKVLDKKVPVSKVECVLRATLDSIST